MFSTFFVRLLFFIILKTLFYSKAFLSGLSLYKQNANHAILSPGFLEFVPLLSIVCAVYQVGSCRKGKVFLFCCLKKSKMDLNWIFPVVKLPKVYLAKTGVKN